MPTATKDLIRLRLGYTAAYATYVSFVRAISDACHRGDRPTDEMLRGEQTAFNDLVKARTAVLEELLRQGKPPEASRSEP